MKRLALSVVVAAVASAAAVAQTAGMMSFQAVLKDGGGVPVIGAVTLDLQIVDAGNVVLDANGDGVVNSSDTFVVNTTAVEGVISIKYGPVAPAAFNGAQRFLKATVTNPPLPALTPVEIVTPPAIAEQLNAPGTGTPALIVKSDGRVGIGVANPSGALDIWGAFRSLNGIIARPNGPTCFNMAGSNGIQTWHFGHFQFKSDAAQLLMDVTDAGNVGIGVTTPDQRLTIAGSVALNGSNSFYYSRPSSGSNADATSLGFASAVGGVLTLSNNGANDIRAGRGSSGGHLRFFVNNTADPLVASNGVEALTIGADGRVGIGSTAPQTKLHVATNTGPAVVTIASPNSEANLTLISDGSGQCTAYSPSGTDDLRFFVGGADRVAVRANGNVGIGLTNPQETLAVQGSIAATGNVFASCGQLCSSDSRFKRNVLELNAALSRVAALRAVAFDWRLDEFPERSFDAKRQIGFIAQDVEKIVPEVVRQGSDGYYSIDYGRLTPLLTAAIQELHAEVWEKDAQLAEQQRRMDEQEARLAAQDVTLRELAARLAKLEAAAAAEGTR